MLYFPCTLPNTFYCPCSPTPSHPEPSWPASDDSQQLEQEQSQRSYRGSTHHNSTLPNTKKIFSKGHLVLLVRLDLLLKKLTAFQCKNNAPLCLTCKKSNSICMLSVVKTPVWESTFNRTSQIKKKRGRECNLNLIKTAMALVMGL